MMCRGVTEQKLITNYTLIGKMNPTFLFITVQTKIQSWHKQAVCKNLLAGTEQELGGGVSNQHY